jgi:aflatoxin B1 aldehyde reductase
LTNLKQLGVCSYSVAQMEEYLSICEQKGYKKPDVYQGEYNAIRRKPETRLFPLLQKHSIAFYAFG